jgi:hypothetical protein
MIRATLKANQSLAFLAYILFMIKKLKTRNAKPAQKNAHLPLEEMKCVFAK